MAVTARLNVKFTAEQTGSNDLGTPTFDATLSALLEFASGTGLNQADVLWTDQRTVADGANDDIDLSGALTSALGTSVVSAEIVGIMIKSAAANTTNLTVGVAGTNPWVTMWAASGDGIKVFPGGVFLNFGPGAAGMGAVVGGASDLLRIANAAGAAATYDIVVLARSA